jgi:hypothetical protein
MQRVPQIVQDWTGDTWKAFVFYRRFPNLDMKVYDCDFGVGVIQIGDVEPLVIDRPTYSKFKKNKELWMNIIKTE